MTPEERARELWGRGCYCESVQDGDVIDVPCMVCQITAAITAAEEEARADERERCWKIATEVMLDPDIPNEASAGKIAAAITAAEEEVRADERERCALLVEERLSVDSGDPTRWLDATFVSLAAAIRKERDSEFGGKDV